MLIVPVKSDEQFGSASAAVGICSGVGPFAKFSLYDAFHLSVGLECKGPRSDVADLEAPASCGEVMRFVADAIGHQPLEHHGEGSFTGDGGLAGGEGA